MFGGPECNMYFLPVRGCIFIFLFVSLHYFLEELPIRMDVHLSAAGVHRIQFHSSLRWLEECGVLRRAG